MIFRFFDLIFSIVGLLVAAPLMLVLLVLGYMDTGSPLFRQTRVGCNQKLFTLFKFRTMRSDTADAATHLVGASAVTPWGSFLRRTKLDELPQLWNVLKGEMSLVGPRPCLPSQRELIDERVQRGVFSVRPGITGLAQVNGIDMSEPKLLAKIDSEMLQNYSAYYYFKYILLTALGKGAGDRVKEDV